MQASTLIEVVIAMVTIVVVFGITMMIYGNVIRSSVSLKKLRAQAVVNGLMLKLTAGTPELQTTDITLDGLHIIQTVKPYNDEKGLNEVDISAYDGNQQLLITSKQVIIAKQR